MSLTSFNIDLFATNNNFRVMDINVETSSDSIVLEWGNIGEEYIVTLDDEYYATTSNQTITITDLKEDHPYAFVISAKKDDKFIDKFVVQTLTKPKEKRDSEYELEDGLTTAIFNDSEAKVIFENVPDSDQVYVVEKDNEKFGKLKGEKNYIIDKNLEPDKQYRYSLVGKKKLTKQQKEKFKKTLKANNINSKSIDVNKVEKEYELARTIKTLKKAQKNKVFAYERWDDPSPGVEFVYTTFIAKSVATFKPWIAEYFTDYHVFHGDGRGFDKYALSEAYRTRTWARVSFPENGGSDIKFDEDYNKTTAKNKNTGNWVTKSTSLDDVYIKDMNKGTTKASFTLYHNAKNPLHNIGSIEAAGITYQYTADVYKSGYFEVRGYHDKAPHHELSFTPIPGETHYMFDSGVTYSTMNSLFQDRIDTQFHFYSLLPGYPQKSISEQGYWK